VFATEVLPEIAPALADASAATAEPATAESKDAQ
jgi:hypothetical protein